MNNLIEKVHQEKNKINVLTVLESIILEEKKESEKRLVKIYQKIRLVKKEPEFTKEEFVDELHEKIETSCKFMLMGYEFDVLITHTYLPVLHIDITGTHFSMSVEKTMWGGHISDCFNVFRNVYESLVRTEKDFYSDWLTNSLENRDIIRLPFSGHINMKKAHQELIADMCEEQIGGVTISEFYTLISHTLFGGFLIMGEFRIEKMQGKYSIFHTNEWSKKTHYHLTIVPVPIHKIWSSMLNCKLCPGCLRLRLTQYRSDGRLINLSKICDDCRFMKSTSKCNICNEVRLGPTKMYRKYGFAHTACHVIETTNKKNREEIKKLLSKIR